ncbi:CoxG family protein [Variovorax ginsengisoli]|uniref:SRPBCC family protein n=1 Tax=Variovorax ginsengisoli TaxID=363844 RepID=A0ABT8S9E6_9BURK|nr:SRPBCC family protein [Variovorax ginsengisoli]MDN8616245.1 SRPBCC family protein [Variovorax ginsengisoli]MDO1535415.1 SRPBCC family protein [Variovorax ginsengisoli]
MEIEKTMTVAAPAAQVWQMLLDPQVMGSCVPGMKSIEVVSEVEYIAQIHVKISFINAKFKLRTTIVEQQAPRYLRCEGTGEDASVASSLKQQSELFLAELPDGRTELRMKVKVDMLGRLGTFGLSVMKTKADRMWEEFGQNLVARLEGGPSVAATAPARYPAAPIRAAAPARAAAPPVAAVVAPAAAPVATTPTAVPAAPASAGRGWWSRLVHGSAADGRQIRIELQRGDTLLKIDWPIEAAADCSAWLREVTK